MHHWMLSSCHAIAAPSTVAAAGQVAGRGVFAQSLLMLNVRSRLPSLSSTHDIAELLLLRYKMRQDAPWLGEKIQACHCQPTLRSKLSSFQKQLRLT
jgi:hypothetical protein